MPSTHDALIELLTSIESIIAEKEARLLVVTGDGARTHLIEDIAKLQVRRDDLLAVIDAAPRPAE